MKQDVITLRLIQNGRHFTNDKFLCNFFEGKCSWSFILTHWGRVTHICVSKLSIIGSDNGLSPDRRQAIILTNAGLLLIGPLGTNFSEILIEILTFSFKKMRLKMSSAKRRIFWLGLNVLMVQVQVQVMTWHHKGDKPLPEPMMTQFTDTLLFTTWGLIY